MSGRSARIWLAGATGYIGRALGRELVARGHEVTAIVRNPASSVPTGCRVLVAEVSDEASLAHALRGSEVDAVFSCLASRTGVATDAWRIDHEANARLLRLSEQAGASHFVLLSAICVQRPKLAFQRAKLAFEAELAASDLAWTVVRPTAFFKSLAGQVERIRGGRPFLMFGDGTLTACKPIGEADLAVYLADCIERGSRARRILPIGGPGPAITPLEQAELLFRLAGRPLKTRSVPVRLFDAIGAMLRPFERVSKGAAAKAELARIGRYYATESMLLWDELQQTYSADATPETGSETLESFYERVLREGLSGQELGAAKVF
ncbi:MAG: NAD(P)H-binding protein [Myxococcota bacterium]